MCWGRFVRRHKYNAKRTTVGSITFDSKREAKRYSALLLLECAGRISDLERQVRYELAPSVKIEGEARRRPALRFTADFRYWCRLTGKTIVEDSKGVPDTAFRIRQHLMKSVHGIDVRLS